MNKIKKFVGSGVALFLIIIIVIFIKRENPYGKWYLYKGNDINTDSTISKQLNSKDYIDISVGKMKTFRSDGKDGVSEMKIKGSKIHAGDAIYKYDIDKIGEYKILVLELIGYENPHIKEKVENGEKFTYVFDKNIELE